MSAGASFKDLQILLLFKHNTNTQQPQVSQGELL